MVTIGTDVNLDTCKEEGYMMMKYDGRKPFKPDTSVIIFRYFPEYIRQEMGIKGAGDKMWTRLDTLDVWEVYQSHKAGIDSFAGQAGGFEYPTDWYELLYLADTVDSYCGLDLDS